MTPKEKAQELVDLFSTYVDYQSDDCLNERQKMLINAKQCALISVDEILNIDNIKPYILHKEIIKYYIEVKKEIEKL